MIQSLFGSGTIVNALKESLDDQSVRQRAIADRVANATTPGVEFADQLNQNLAENSPNEVNLQDEMAALADTSMRFDAATRLLQRTYQQFRTAINGRA